jgi:hypothetical protein
MNTHDREYHAQRKRGGILNRIVMAYISGKQAVI